MLGILGFLLFLSDPYEINIMIQIMWRRRVFISSYMLHILQLYMVKLWLLFKNTCILNQLEQKLETGTWKQGLKQRPQKGFNYFLGSCFVIFITAPVILPTNSTGHRRLCHSTSISNQENAPQTWHRPAIWRQLVNWNFPFPTSQVENQDCHYKKNTKFLFLFRSNSSKALSIRIEWEGRHRFWSDLN